MTSEQLRGAFLVEKLFRSDRAEFTFTDLDRQAIAGIEPHSSLLSLKPDRETGTEFFLARRELGVINVGGAGTIVADGKSFELANLDGLYVGMGTREVSFASQRADQPAKLYCVSTPAHQTYPTTRISKNEATPRSLGSQSTANVRKIYQYIHQGGIKSCQLVMGFTELAEGSVWNTMPPHTHSRRSEIYFYFDLNGQIVFHLMGEPDQTRNLVVKEAQAVLSPPWSIHCGCGTGSYRFIWAMGGENQTFDDMDQVAIDELR